MRAHTVLSVLRRCLSHWMPALAVALLLVLGGGTSWAQTAVPTGPDTEPTPAYLPPPDDPDPPAPYDDAAVVSISAPATMTPGSTAYVTVTMRNSGTTTWYPGLTTYPYRLGSQNPANNSTWGVGRVELGSTVAPGGQVVFGFTITAPTTAGTYSFSWGMLRENLAWFGAIASSTITVSAPAPVYDAQLVSASVPAQMGVGGNYNVSLTFKNTGNVTWTQSDYRIGSSSPADNTTWGFARVDMGVASVAPGQSATFNFQVHAPATAGTYLFDWGMLYELHWRFGQTTGISVTVGGTNSSVTYIHTDGLGSPVARTDGAGNVISRTRYEPYGYVASGVQPTIGFTGHVNDVDTGLTYMQQRYYDPVAGRFLSIDPVVTDSSTGDSFNRYAYANNNPLNYVDPDGRMSEQICADMGSQNCQHVDGGGEGGEGGGSGHETKGTQLAAVASFKPNIPGAAEALPRPTMEIAIDALTLASAAGATKNAATFVVRKLAIRAAAEDTTTLFRAVTEGELRQVLGNGRFEAGPNSLGGKWMAESAEHAKTWGDLMNGPGKSTILRIEMPTSQANKLMRVERLDGIGPARYGELKELLDVIIKTK